MYEDYIERGPGVVPGRLHRHADERRGAREGAALHVQPPVEIERQCLAQSPWVAHYRPLALRIWSEVDESGAVVAWVMGGDYLRDNVASGWTAARTLRQRMASSSGFTTGKWEGDTLVARTTHVKTAWIRRGVGIPAAIESTFTVLHHAARQPAHAHDDSGGPDLLDGAARRQPRVGVRSARRARARCATPATSAARSRRSRTRAKCRTICPGRTPKRTTWCAPTTCRRKRRWVRAHALSRVSQDAATDLQARRWVVRPILLRMDRAAGTARRRAGTDVQRRQPAARAQEDAHEPGAVDSRYLRIHRLIRNTVPFVAVVFGWPAVIVSILLALGGIATTRSKTGLAGAIVACPFLFYLFLTPRLQWVAPPVAVLLFLAARAVARRRHRTALVMVAPYVGLAVFVAWLVVNQGAG